MLLLLVEDDAKIASFVIKGFRAEGFTVDHAADGESGLAMAMDKDYDVLIIDLMLPVMDGLELIRRLRRNRIQTPIIILSARDRVEDRVRGLQSGSDDYLVKPFAFSELLARVQALIRRASGVAEPQRLQVADLVLDLATRKVTRNGVRIDLQPLEYSLLEYLMRNAGRVVSRAMIMEHVWNYNFDPQTNVVEARICRLRDKIDRDFEKKLIHTVRGAGYRLEADE